MVRATSRFISFCGGFRICSTLSKALRRPYEGFPEDSGLSAPTFFKGFRGLHFGAGFEALRFCSGLQGSGLRTTKHRNPQTLKH